MAEEYSFKKVVYLRDYDGLRRPCEEQAKESLLCEIVTIRELRNRASFQRIAYRLFPKPFMKK